MKKTLLTPYEAGVLISNALEADRPTTLNGKKAARNPKLAKQLMRQYKAWEKSEDGVILSQTCLELDRLSILMQAGKATPEQVAEYSALMGSRVYSQHDAGWEDTIKARLRAARASVPEKD